jgi:hypothetical protein
MATSSTTRSARSGPSDASSAKAARRGAAADSSPARRRLAENRRQGAGSHPGRRGVTRRPFGGWKPTSSRRIKLEASDGAGRPPGTRARAGGLSLRRVRRRVRSRFGRAHPPQRGRRLVQPLRPSPGRLLPFEWGAPTDSRRPPTSSVLGSHTRRGGCWVSPLERAETGLQDGRSRQTSLRSHPYPGVADGVGAPKLGTTASVAVGKGT